MLGAEVTDACSGLSALHPLPPADREEINLIIAGRKNGKASGAAGIGNCTLKELRSVVVDHMATIMNSSSLFGDFPSEWKRTDVIMARKQGKDRCCRISPR